MTTNSKRALICGSVAFDTIMVFQDRFRNHILPDKIHMLNVSFLVGWAFNVAASANLPSLVMLLFWKRTTKQGIAAAIIVGMVSSLTWILCSAQAFRDVYGWAPETAPVPFSQPGIVTIPLGFLVLVVVSLLTPRPADAPAPRPRPV